MNCLAIGEKFLASGAKYGKHKIPRFIYHMTSKKNYDSMLKDGVIKTTQDVLINDGVFATELTNLFKRWRKSRDWGGNSLQEKLIQQVAKGHDEIVILKIPTAKLNQDKLRVRSQNSLFGWQKTENARTILADTQKELSNLPQEDHGWTDKIINLLRKHMYQSMIASRAEHLTKGAPAKDSHLFKQRKQALEYVYHDNIPITDAEKIGEVDIAQLRKSADYDIVRPMRSIFTALLKGTPEVKGAELLTC